MKNVVVLGGGAIGSVIAAALSRKPDHSVLMVGRKAQVEAVRARGLRVVGKGDERFDFDAREGVDAPLDATLVLLTVKTHQIAPSLSAIAPRLRRNTVLLLLENGHGIKEAALAALAGSAVSPENVHQGIVAMGVTLLEPGVARFFGGGIRFERSFLASGFGDVFDGTFLKSGASDDFRKDVWSKLLVNCVVNPLSVLIRGRNNSVSDPRLDPLKERIVREVLAVAAAEGVPLDRDVAFVNRFITSDNVTSMLADVLRGRKTEIDFLNGAIVALGRAHGVPTPANELLVLLVEANELVSGEGRSVTSLTTPAPDGAGRSPAA